MIEATSIQRIQVIDSHTAGEPTRLVLDGGPDLGSGSLAERLERFRSHHDGFRSAVVNEPRGSDVMVGALLCEPFDPGCDIAVIFFNNVGYLGMCGHGTIGVIASLAHLGKIKAGTYKIETPVGTVNATLHASGKVTIKNVPSYRSRTRVAVRTAGFGTITGDIAWGGNWFFLAELPADLSPDLVNIEKLTDLTRSIKHALAADGLTGKDGAEIDHIELFSAPSDNQNHSRNFVLCPGNAYDRSPCGTGTSAKMACLSADNQLSPGEIWRQEGILGTVFEGSIEVHDGGIVPSITGQAYVTAESTLILSENDPFRQGILP